MHFDKKKKNKKIKIKKNWCTAEHSKGGLHWPYGKLII